MAAKNILSHFEKIDSEEKAYWLGFLYADGYISFSENKIELSLAEKDVHHIEKFRDFLGINNRICYRPSAKAYRLSFRSDKCKQDLINQGCTPRKSLTLKFPTSKQVPHELIRHFIRGYFDGDGWFSNTKCCFQVGLIGTQDFIQGFLECINFANTQNKIFTVHLEDGAKRYIFSAYKDIFNFLNWIYKDATIYLDRKYQAYQDFLSNGKNYKK